jgi:hypothetical protein
VFGGIALGILFDIDPWKASARAAQARGLQTQVEGLEKFAGTGIPMEVRKAHDDAIRPSASRPWRPTARWPPASG